MSSQEKIRQLQMFEQSLQALLMQKQQFQLQLSEIESALTEISGKEDAYKIVGNIMVAAKVKDIAPELESKKETVNLRIQALDKQEKDIREKAEAMQKEVMAEMKENG